MENVKRNRQFIVAGAFFLAVAIGVTVNSYNWSVANRRARSLVCANQVVAICFAARAWAADHNGAYPTNFLCFSNELANPVVLHCPADRSRPQVQEWRSFGEDLSSYEIINAHMREGDSNVVFLRCKVHGHLGYGDDTVFDGISRHRKLP